MYNPGRRSTAVPAAPLKLVTTPRQSFTIVEQVVVVALRGSLTELSVPVVRAHLLSLVSDDGPAEIIINLVGVTSMNEAGARPLLEADRLQHARHGFLSISEISYAAADFLETHPGFDEMLASGGTFSGPSGCPSQPSLYLAGPVAGADEYPGA